jgi:hypothetical protein
MEAQTEVVQGKNKVTDVPPSNLTDDEEDLEIKEQLAKEKKVEVPVKKAPVILDDAKLKDMSILFGMP